MVTFILRRLLFSIPVIVLASVVIFFGVSSVGDPLGELRTRPNVSQVTLDNIVERKALDQPLPAQYLLWVQEATTNRFGTTLLGDRPIWPDLRRALWFTLQLVIAAEVLALIIGIGLGVLSAKRQYSVFDYATTTISFLGYSIPIFWFALILQVIFTNIYRATGTRIFYTAGLSSTNPGTGLEFFIDRLQHLALPIIALAYISLALYSRYMRSSMLEVINADYVRTARAKGLRETLVTRKHAMRNALIPIVTLAALNFGALIGGAIVTEAVFSIPGMGSYFIRALTARDVYPIMAFLMITTIFIIIANLVADILYGYLDPRIRNE
ncbi:MAG TPA: ABC transporter permease [Egibacteraceae bacterium]|nr:ABC transporter permease [Egibacteraceae bacterium]